MAHGKRGLSANTAVGFSAVVGLLVNSILFFLNVYSFLKDRERQSTNRGGAEREGDTESETGSRL